MTTLEPWGRRPPEEAYLFNPAFMGSLAYEYAKVHMKERESAAPLTFLLIAYTVVLHRPTRSRLPRSTITSLPSWSQDNEDILVGLAERQQGVQPYALEGIRFAIGASVLEMGEGHGVQPGPRKAAFSAPYRRAATAEAIDVIERMKFAARWFARSGSEATILAMWRFRP